MGMAEETQEGQSSPLGATVCAEGTNFSVYSKHATAVELLLFDCVDDARPLRAIRVDPSVNRTHVPLLAHLRARRATRADLWLSGRGTLRSCERHAIRRNQSPPRPVWPRGRGS